MYTHPKFCFMNQAMVLRIYGHTPIDIDDDI